MTASTIPSDSSRKASLKRILEHYRTTRDHEFDIIRTQTTRAALAADTRYRKVLKETALALQGAGDLETAQEILALDDSLLAHALFYYNSTGTYNESFALFFHLALSEFPTAHADSAILTFQKLGYMLHYHGTKHLDLFDQCVTSTATVLLTPEASSEIHAITEILRWRVERTACFRQIGLLPGKMVDIVHPLVSLFVEMAHRDDRIWLELLNMPCAKEFFERAPDRFWARVTKERFVKALAHAPPELKNTLFAQLTHYQMPPQTSNAPPTR